MRRLAQKSYFKELLIFLQKYDPICLEAKEAAMLVFFQQFFLYNCEAKEKTKKNFFLISVKSGSIHFKGFED